MPALWTYPWTLNNQQLGDICGEIKSCGVDSLNLASHYHSVRSMQPRFCDDLFREYSGGCYFDPGSSFDELTIEPPVTDIGPWEDPLAEIVEGVHDHGLRVNAWTVLLHNTALGESNPEYRFESAFGDVHDHSLCPSYPEVRDYYAKVIESVAARDADEIHLESIGFPSVFHDHGADYGHDKRHTLSSEVEEVLLSQCFCSGCRAAASSHEVDLDRAQEIIQNVLDSSLADPTYSPPSLSALVNDNETIRALFDFRTEIIETLVEQIATAAGSTPLNYYVMEAYGSDPNSLRPAGVRLPELEDYFDRVTAICYVTDPTVAANRIKSLEDLTSLPIDAGITLNPDVIESREQLVALVNAIRNATDGCISIYHYSLATTTHLDWISTIFE